MTHVIIPDYPTRVQFALGATLTNGPFAFSFTFFATADIDVYVGSTLATEGLQYTVTGNPGKEGGFEGGSVTLVNLFNNTTVTIQRNIPLERVSDFPVAGSFNRQTLNTTLDKHVAMIQQVDERVDRAFTSPPSSPPMALVANYFPRVNVAATGMELISPTQVRTEIAAQPLDATLTALASLATAAAQIIVTTAPDTFTMQPITPAGLALIDDANAAAQRTTLGLGTMATQNSNAVNITGGSISGVAVAVPGLGTMSTQNANAVNITGGAITGMPMPVNPFDVVTKNYADNLAFGVNKRSTVRVASTANVVISAVIGGTTLDGVVLAVSDRVLFKDQTNHAQNGVYLVGVASTSLRAADFDTYDECPGSLVTIQEGTVNQDTVYLCTSNAGGVLDTTPIDFSKVKVSPTIPVVIGEGGTGQTTAAAAFDALKQLATTAYVGAVQLATQAEVNAGTDASKAVTPATLASSSRMVRHDCRFDYVSPTTCRLQRYGGSQITIDAQLRTIPLAGVDLAYSLTGAPAAGTLLYIYAKWDGANIILAPNGTGPTFDPRDGNSIMNGDPTAALVGLIVGGYGTFMAPPSYVGVLSAWNKVPRSLQAVWSGLQTGSTAPVPISAGAVFTLSWGDEPTEVMIAGYASNNGGITACVIDSYINGAGTAGGCVAHCGGVNYNVPQVVSHAKVLAPGWYQIMPFVYVSGGLGTWTGMQTIIVKG